MILVAGRMQRNTYLRCRLRFVEEGISGGGFAEASVIAFHWGVRVGIFARSREEFFLLCDPVGPQHAAARICLFWTGTHYEVLVMDDAQWKKACTPSVAGMDEEWT